MQFGSLFATVSLVTSVWFPAGSLDAVSIQTFADMKLNFFASLLRAQEQEKLYLYSTEDNNISRGTYENKNPGLNHQRMGGLGISNYTGFDKSKKDHLIAFLSF